MMFGNKYHELLLSMTLNYIPKIFFNITDNQGGEAKGKSVPVDTFRQENVSLLRLMSILNKGESV